MTCQVLCTQCILAFAMTFIIVRTQGWYASRLSCRKGIPCSGRLKQQKFVSRCSGDWDSEMRVPACSGSGVSLLAGFFLTVSSHGGHGGGGETGGGGE